MKKTDKQSATRIVKADSSPTNQNDRQNADIIVIY